MFGISSGRFARARMYLDTGCYFAPLRAAYISRWAGSPAHTALANGDYVAADAAACQETDSPPLWGEFAPGSATCPVCGCQHPTDDSATCGVCEWSEGIRSAANNAVDVAQHGISALAQTASVFVGALQEKRKHSGCCNAVNPSRENSPTSKGSE